MTVPDKHRCLRWFLAGCSTSLILALFGVWSLPWWLIAMPQVLPADVILHAPLEPSPAADEYAVALYRQNIAPKIVCVSKPALCDLYPADYARQQLIAMGVPAEDVLTLHLPNADCAAQNLPRVVAMVKEHGWQRAVLVQRAPLTRAEGTLANKYFGQSGLQVAVTSAPQDRAKFGFRWWTDHKTAQLTIHAILIALLDPLYPECR